MATKKKTTKTKASGPTQTRADREAAGRRRVEVWLSEAVVERLDAMRGTTSRRDAVEAAMRTFLGLPAEEE